MTIEANVGFPLRRHARLAPAEQKERVRNLLSSVGMDSGLDKMPSEISGGMKKRVGLARAHWRSIRKSSCSTSPPRASTPISSAEISHLILKLKKECSITSIVVTHDIHSAKKISDRLVVLQEGKVAVE